MCILAIPQFGQTIPYCGLCGLLWRREEISVYSMGMRKATIMALELSIDHGQDVLRQRESMIYRLFDTIIGQQPSLKNLAQELAMVEPDDRQKRRALIDPVIDRSIVKLVDLDEDGLSELVIYFNSVPNNADGGDVYVFRQQGTSLDCIGQFPSRSCPEVKRDEMENGYARLAALRLSDRGRLVPALYTYMGGGYVLDERHLLLEEMGEVVLAH